MQWQQSMIVGFETLGDCPSKEPMADSATISGHTAHPGSSLISQVTFACKASNPHSNNLTLSCVHGTQLTDPSTS